MKLGAVILAAGSGTRLGGVAKALLVGRSGRSFLSSIVDAVRAVGADDIVVVVGPPFGDEVGAHAAALGASVVVNPTPQRGMASSVALGFAAITETDCTAAWLWPVDHPNIDAATLHALVGALGEYDAARPVFEGRGGHPPLIARSMFSDLAACADVEGGARSVLARHDVVDVVVTDKGVVRDIDTRRDLEAL